MIEMWKFVPMLSAFFALVTGQNSETVLPNPAYENIATCPCDLTQNQWDNNCCCDPDIDPAEPEISDCIQGFFGGTPTITNENLCRSNQSFTPDWFPFTCIEFLNTPDLGLYYYPVPVIGDTSAATVSYVYEQTALDPISCSSTYILGSSICSSNAGNTGILTLPQNTLNGHCITNSPVQYLINTSSSCDRTVDSTICAAGQLLDAATYALTGVVILPTNITATVSYFCSNATNDPNYVKTNTGKSTLGAESLFTPSPPSSSVVPCTAAPAPSVSGSTCQNAVADVKYEFTWGNAFISALNIAITLVDVSFTTFDAAGPNFVLTQTFSSTFVNANYTVSDEVRSGNPGYEFGLPVISGSSAGGDMVSPSSISQLRIWSPGSSGLCADSSKMPPYFGYDVISGCNLVFAYQDCATLRQLVEDEQRAMLQNATHVSRFGNANDTDTTYWIPVIGNLTELNETTVIDGQCQGIPSRANMEFLWAKTGVLVGQDIREIVGVKVSWTRETWNIPCNSSTDTCSFNVYPIYSSVTFREVPAQVTSGPTTYDLSRNDTCKKDATCWSELLLPIQPEFFYLFDLGTADVLLLYNYRWALVVTFFSIAAALVPAHWNSVGRYIKQFIPL